MSNRVGDHYFWQQRLAYEKNRFNYTRNGGTIPLAHSTVSNGRGYGLIDID